MNYFIFVINDTEDELSSRLKAKKWQLYKSTPNRKKIGKGDKAIIYQAGIDKHRFVGEFTLCDFKENDSLIQYAGIDSIRIWKKPIDIKTIYEKLEIIRKPKSYGAYLAGGVRKISQADYELIISKRT